EQKPVLELNPAHTLVKNLQTLYGKDRNHPKIAEYAALLYDQALLMEGQKLKDPAGFARRLNALLVGESQGLLSV
ncbi:MAG: molecular chaperone HtpG, partial [Fibrobacterota bacterium]